MDTTAAEVGKTEENYLEAILMIKERQGYVRSVDVAAHLGQIEGLGGEAHEDASC